MSGRLRSLLLAYGVLATFVVVERRLRGDAAARSLEATATDRGTTRLIGAAFAFGMSAGLVAPWLSHRGPGRLPGAVQPVGLMGMLAGLLLRVWSARTLGRFYTRTLRTDQDQSVVQSGPYAFVRHPGYAADILLWFGFGLAVGNALVLGAITSVMAGVYGLRIRAEEAMLVQALGTAYVHYQARTARLIPGLL